MIGIIFFLLTLIVLLYTIIFHEISHGFVSERFGDLTPRMMGRLSFNPVVHIDLLGTIALPLLLIMTGSPIVFGWAKPVPINPNYYKDPDKDIAIVGLAGPLTNFTIAFLFSLLIKFVPLPFNEFGNMLRELMIFAVRINILFAVFNLIPIPPLDGSRLLRSVLPYEGQRIMDNMEQYGFYLLVLFLLFPGTSIFISSLVDIIFNLFLRL